MLAIIETHDLTKRFHGVTAVDGLTLQVQEGEVFGLLGPNGAGKTTTVRMLCCLIGKTSGEARVAGYDVGREPDSLMIRRLIGLVTDNVGLYDELTAYQNLDFYGKLYECPEPKRGESIRRFLTMLGLWEKRSAPAGTFSKGMKQKLAIARALIHEPAILFMDEPTANLDPESAKTVRDFILDLKRERRTIVLNTHNLAEAQRICDRIAVLNTRLVATGSPDELERLASGRRVEVRVERMSEAIAAAVRAVADDVKVDGNTITVHVQDPDRRMPAVVGAVVGAGGAVQSAGVAGSSLEDAYLQLVKDGRA